MDNYTAVLRKDLVQNKELASEISEVLSKYEFRVPKGKTVVWGPTVIDDADTIFDAYGILIDGIPAPWILEAAQEFQERFAIER